MYKILIIIINNRRNVDGDFICSYDEVIVVKVVLLDLDVFDYFVFFGLIFFELIILNDLFYLDRLKNYILNVCIKCWFCLGDYVVFWFCG